MLVGAPLANTDQPGVERGGAVYRCSIDTPDACQQIAFDRSGNTMFLLLFDSWFLISFHNIQFIVLCWNVSNITLYYITSSEILRASKKLNRVKIENEFILHDKLGILLSLILLQFQFYF